MRRVTSRILTAGLFAGLAGYATVVVLFAAVNLVAGRSPFYTAALFGSWLFFGTREVSPAHVAAAPVLAYNMVHMVVFLALGIFASAMAALAERYPAARYAVLFAFIFVIGHLYAALLVFAHPLLSAPAWWEIGAATVAAAAVMASVLLALYPEMRRELRTLPIGSE